MIKIASMSKEVLGKAYASAGFIKWTVVVINDIAGIPFRAEIEIQDDENPFIRWYEPDQPEAEIRDDEDDEGNLVWLIKSGDEEIVTIPDATWTAVHMNDVTQAALAAVAKVEAAEYAAVKAIINGEEVAA